MKKEEQNNLIALKNYENFIYKQQPVILNSSLSQLRYLILTEGLPEIINHSNNTNIRLHVWSILLQCSMVNCTTKYLKLLGKGPPPIKIYDKIKNDTFRTLNTDVEFKTKVAEASLIRCLSCFSWGILERETEMGTEMGTERGIEREERLSTYVQGMNVLLAPLLYISNGLEPMAFQLFNKLCRYHIPTYLDRNLTGVYKGCQLVEICLFIIDPTLSKFLRQEHLLTAEIYGVPSILTLSACTPPLHQVIKLWDFMFAYGFHMNLLFIVAQLVLIRTELLNNPSPINFLNNLPPFNAEDVIRLGVGFLAKIPDDIYELLVTHLYNYDVAIPNML
ncbi:Bub2p SCDLUD_004061 [Saccharomycodes ludwigii]|uniref:Bub2p n=1 Tax=Saccharomycodes ludwigii TaxID=36035 RepID=UPI001E8685A8|nr:hypothetical protein SCDLUD_004061 [Saccharomycodes ludwigii]KAH3899773.1 hypothetical protein SCDLUD_004061 [Saccharomycodes ludwigii]